MFTFTYHCIHINIPFHFPLMYSCEWIIRNANRSLTSNSLLFFTVKILCHVVQKFAILVEKFSLWNSQNDKSFEKIGWFLKISREHSKLTVNFLSQQAHSKRCSTKTSPAKTHLMPLQNEITSYCTHLVSTSGPTGMWSCIYVQCYTSRLHATMNQLLYRAQRFK